MNVTIVGGGFGGVKTALELAKNNRNHITLISDKPDFQYYPALYSSATGHSHLESWVPLGEIFGNLDNVHVHLDTIQTIDPEKKILTGTSGVDYSYETVVLALGSVTTYFGIKGLDTFAYGIKSAAEIKRLKQHIYHEIAEEGMIDKQYVIVGAGPTGVELASALGEYVQRLCRKYHVRRRTAKVVVVEAAPRVLPKMSEITSHKVSQHLKKLGVVVETGRMVQAASAEGLVVDGKQVDSQTVIWTSGVANHPFFTDNAKWFELAKNHKVVVDEHFKARDGVYVIGDNADTPFSGLAQIAVRNAKELTANFERHAAHKPLKKYSTSLPPVVIPVGAWWAAFEWHGLRFYGWPAALVRRAADFIGYHDILPISGALGKLRSGSLVEDDYFTPTVNK